MSIMGSKPLASLSSGLLARKGQARPAMRPQGYGGFGAIPDQQDDLGWNDMGHDVPPAAYVAPVPPVVRQLEQLHEEFDPAPQAWQSPAAAVQQAVEQDELADAPAPEAEFVPPAAPAAEAGASGVVRSVSVATATRLDRETAVKTKHGKAAFTLRLDHERHLRLRIASALCHRSAQALVTEALDSFLYSLPEVDALVSQLPPTKARR